MDFRGSRDEGGLNVGRNVSLPTALDTPEQRLNPFPWYREMRDSNPVRYDPDREVWDVFRYGDVKEVLTTGPPMWSTETSMDEDARSELEGTPLEPMMTQFLARDPPYHDKIRELLEPYFEPGYLRERRDQLDTVAERQIDQVLSNGSEFDFRQDLARPIPVNTIAALLGVPVERRDDVRIWSDTIVAEDADEADEKGMTQDDKLERITEMFRYLDGLIDEKREDPRDDLISELLEAEIDGRPLSQTEIIGNAMILLVAGNVTTVNFLTSTIWTLYEEDLLQDFVRGDVKRKPILEEVLRYRSPVKTVNRTPAEPVELRGKTISPGERVELWLGSANRDERTFDDPDVFDPDRRPNSHLAFGRGLHFCLGAPLSRLEIEITFDKLFERISDIEVRTDVVEPLDSFTLYGTRTLPVSVDQ
jgi:cytochrome P450